MAKKQNKKPKKDKKQDKRTQISSKITKQEKTGNKFDASRKSRFFSLERSEKKVDQSLVKTPKLNKDEINLSRMQLALKRKMDGSKFRILNEKLYTTNGADAFEMFNDDPELFQIYHDGFTESVKTWPANPLDRMIMWLTKKPKTWIVGDFGCGVARLAESVPQTVHSFDLVAANDRVTACDIAHVPLEDETLDCAIFCLSLMGTNFMDYLAEANRVLKIGGILKVVEVESRFPNPLKFQDLLIKMGFTFTSKQEGNNYFIVFEFVKKEHKQRIPNVTPSTVMKPCLYKKR